MDYGKFKRVQNSYYDESIDPFGTQRDSRAEEEQSLSSVIGSSMNIAHDDTFPPVIFDRKPPKQQQKQPVGDHYYSPKPSLSTTEYQPIQRALQNTYIAARPSTSSYHQQHQQQQQQQQQQYHNYNYQQQRPPQYSAHSYNQQIYSSQNRIAPPPLQYSQYQQPPRKTVNSANFLEKTWKNENLTVFDEHIVVKKPKKEVKKQVRMDEFLFKARRVDKGSREFGLLTTHEPKRGSRKKRNSIDRLELKENEMKQEEMLDETIQLDETLPPKPETPPRLKQQTIPYFRRFINDFKGTSTEKEDEEKEKSSKKRKITDYSNDIFSTSKRGPKFEEDYAKKEEKVLVEKRETLQKMENERKIFGKELINREEMVKKLVDQQFMDQCKNGFEKRMEIEKCELRDGDVIRNKMARKNLMHGKSCKCCQSYYEKLDMPQDEKKAYIDKISRHRYVNNALPDTPEHYWDMTLGPSDEQLFASSSSQKSSWTVQENPTKLANWD